MKHVVSLQKVSKSYTRANQQVSVLRDIDLLVEAGDFVAFMGPSGSGKSTMLNLIGGLDSPDAGDILAAGEHINRLSPSSLTRWRRRHVGFVFQFYNLLPRLSAARNVELPLLVSGLSAAERRRSVSAALDLVGLAGRSDHRPTTLSGGEQQRVAIARALVSDPALLLCDEPTGDLDRKSAEQILDLLQMVNQQLGSTVLMVTHDVLAAGYAKRTIHLDKGCLSFENPRIAA